MKNYMSNLGFIDGAILLLFIANVIISIYCNKYAVKIEQHFSPTSYFFNANEESKKALKDNTSIKKALSDDELMEIYKRQNSLYAFFVNITSIMPLCGMFGTVYGLLDSSDKLESGFSGSFFIALTTTLTGIIFSIICKIIDAIISPILDRNEKYMEYLFNPNRKQ